MLRVQFEDLELHNDFMQWGMKWSQINPKMQFDDPWPWIGPPGHRMMRGDQRIRVTWAPVLNYYNSRFLAPSCRDDRLKSSFWRADGDHAVSVLESSDSHGRINLLKKKSANGREVKDCRRRRVSRAMWIWWFASREWKWNAAIISIASKN